MCRESGAHAKSSTLASAFVSCCASPPSAGITHSCCLFAGDLGSTPARLDRNASHLPSGDHCAATADDPSVVSRCRSPVATLATHWSDSNLFASQSVRDCMYTTCVPSGEITGELTLCISSD